MKCFRVGYRGICHASLVTKGSCVYEENTSDKWHVSLYRTRKHCILFYPMPKSSENLGKFWEELGHLREFPKTSETIQPVLEELKHGASL